MSIRNTINFIIPYFYITIGLFIFAFGWTAFLIPSEIIGGGITGLGALIFFVSGFPVGYTTLIANAILILIALKILGAKFGINTIYGIIISSIFFIILQKYITEPFVKDQFMAALIGGGLGGVGVGIAFSHGGNSGGTDIIALIINKYRNISPGRIFLYIDIFIIASSWFIFYSIEKIVYGYVVMAVASYSVDLIINGSRQSYQIMIYSNYDKIIADRISKEVKRGVTCLKAHGWYSKKDINVVMVIARKHDKPKIMAIVKDTDSNAFISIAKVMGVFGQNFDEVKL
ncbi:MAG: YitT family protein [Bacteroidales bacterium]|nr:YitT family protein [Bacteroidales bacterium]MBN2756735.1 YitT family protein [Bacteroidales bacterium]